MEKREQYLYIILCTVSSLLLISKNDFFLLDLGLVLMSLPLLKRPVTYIPLLFVASWSQSFGVLGLGAFYYYFLLFLASLFLCRKSDVMFVGSSFSTRIYLCLAGWIVFTMFKSLSHEMSYSIKLSITIFLVFLASNYRYKDSGYCKKCILCISFVASLFFFYRAAFSPMEFVVEKFNSWGVSSETYQSIMDGVNPNSASPIMAILTIMLLTESIQRHNPIYLIPSLMNMYTMVFLGSRTAFYTLFIVLAYYFLVYVKISRLTKIIVFLMALLVIVMAAYLISILDTHLSDSVIEDDGSGRFVTWALLAVYVIPNYWLWGIGLGRENYDALGYGYDADNLYFDLLCQTGIIGFALFFYIFLFTIRKAYLTTRGNSSLDGVYIILLAFVFLGIGESIFDTLFFWGTLLYANTIIDLGQMKPLKNSI